MIEFICFLVFVVILVGFWGLGNEAIGEERKEEERKEEERKENILPKKLPNPPQNTITLEVKKEKKQEILDQNIPQTNKIDVIPQKEEFSAIFDTNFDIKNNLFIQKLRLKQYGNITEKHKIAGIYAIFCEKNHRIYIGSSINLYARMKQHLFELKHKKHHSYRLQQDFDQFGEAYFSFWVLEA